MAGDDVVAIVDDRALLNRANREDETLRRIDDGGEGIDADSRRDSRR